jgi:hypothetical protein
MLYNKFKSSKAHIASVLFFASMQLSFASTAEQSIAPVQEAEKSWSAVTSIEHYLGFRPDVYDYTQLYADFTYKLGSGATLGKDKLRILQGLQKHYDVAVTEDEIRFDDTALFWYHDFETKILLFNSTLRISTTLPVSTVSQNNGNITRSSAMLQFTRKFFKNSVTLRYWPSFTYYFNSFTTTVSGTPLTEATLGNRIITEFSLTSRLTFSLDASYTFLFSHKSPFAQSSPSANGKYALSAEFGYEIASQLGARLGFSQADSFTKEGRYEILVFDPYASQGYLALDYSF